ncbi:PREDICTED: uncharacterized protein LOC106806714 isoform X2 [Priapulus caudatus]|uniref:Uncharacterized protein LOC106806714 isoform X2 n=1 Tax=Priapulus caudatus TaxID=37621 RepID=A0ABM1DWA6_PRICU|nr:PREDICTED: uncharacterized protein LOC106806714 isoform X2 [Priapulus caudatus]
MYVYILYVFVLLIIKVIVQQRISDYVISTGCHKSTLLQDPARSSSSLKITVQHYCCDRLLRLASTLASMRVRIATVKSCGRLPFACRRTVAVIAAVFCITALCLTINYDHGSSTGAGLWPQDAEDQEVGEKWDMVDPDVHSERWIVVTSVNQPTEDIRKMASMSDWKVVVVGDKKSPPDWSEANCIYLGPEKQQSLGYGILKKIPWNNYARKNIGYLYAIEHGAKYIFDTDDDNHPTDNLNSFVYGPTMTGLVTECGHRQKMRRFLNPYAHFGQPTIWPRGFPLGEIALNVGKKYAFCKFKTPVIQQGIVNGDPDVDAIFRLTRKKVGLRLNITFDGTAPPVVLSPGTFSPFNSQNTLFHHAAFWGLLLPVTTTSRVCDIWRGYWVQRLLWETGDQLAFFGPTSFQRRNSHSYMNDASDEADLYYKSNSLVDLLLDYQCKADDIYICMIELTNEMVRHDFIQLDDALLMRTWINDLKAVGYKPPAKQRRTDEVRNNNCHAEQDKGVEVLFEPRPQPTSLIHSPSPKRVLQNEAAIKSLQRNICPAFVQSPSRVPQSGLLFDDILLIIIFNGYHTDTIPILEVMYRPSFPNILYCGEFRPEQDNRTFANIKYSFYAVPKMGLDGYNSYECTIGAIRMGYNVSGFLVIGDDVRLNIQQWTNLNRSALIFDTMDVIDLPKVHCRFRTPNRCLLPSKAWLLAFYREELVKTFNHLKSSPTKSLERRCYNNLVTENRGEYRFNNELSDVYYIPRRLASDFATLASLFAEKGVFVEIAIPTLIRCLDKPANVQKAKYLYIVGRNRTKDALWTHWEESLNYHSYHPYKLSPVLKKDRSDVQHFCKQVLPRMSSCRPTYWHL